MELLKLTTLFMGAHGYPFHYRPMPFDAIRCDRDQDIGSPSQIDFRLTQCNNYSSNGFISFRMNIENWRTCGTKGFRFVWAITQPNRRHGSGDADTGLATKSSSKWKNSFSSLKYVVGGCTSQSRSMSSPRGALCEWKQRVFWRYWCISESIN